VSLACRRSKVIERRARKTARGKPGTFNAGRADQTEKPTHDENAQERQIAPEIRN
jgi:hypothetical protein